MGQFSWKGFKCWRTSRHCLPHGDHIIKFFGTGCQLQKGLTVQFHQIRKGYKHHDLRPIYMWKGMLYLSISTFQCLLAASIFHIYGDDFDRGHYVYIC